LEMPEELRRRRRSSRSRGASSGAVEVFEDGVAMDVEDVTGLLDVGGVVDVGLSEIGFVSTTESVVYSAVVLLDVHVIISLSLTGDEVTVLVDKLTASSTVDNSELLLSVAGSGAVIAAFLVWKPLSEG
jgi:hypothetical protein